MICDPIRLQLLKRISRAFQFNRSIDMKIILNLEEKVAVSHKYEMGTLQIIVVS